MKDNQLEQNWAELFSLAQTNNSLSSSSSTLKQRTIAGLSKTLFLIDKPSKKLKAALPEQLEFLLDAYGVVSDASDLATQDNILSMYATATGRFGLDKEVLGKQLLQHTKDYKTKEHNKYSEAAFKLLDIDPYTDPDYFEGLVKEMYGSFNQYSGKLNPEFLKKVNDQNRHALAREALHNTRHKIAEGDGITAFHYMLPILLDETQKDQILPEALAYVAKPQKYPERRGDIRNDVNFLNDIRQKNWLTDEQTQIVLQEKVDNLVKAQLIAEEERNQKNAERYSQQAYSTTMVLGTMDPEALIKNQAVIVDAINDDNTYIYMHFCDLVLF